MKNEVYTSDKFEKMIEDMNKNPQRFIGKFIDIRDGSGKPVIRGYIREINEHGIKIDSKDFKVGLDTVFNPIEEKNN